MPLASPDRVERFDVCPRRGAVRMCNHKPDDVTLAHPFIRIILPTEETSLENLARYIIRASFSQERMQYLDHEGTVIYAAKDGNDRKVFDAGEWLAAMCSHVSNRGEHTVQ
jgi:hypothetical protein